MPEAGLEPARPFGQPLLRRPRLPITALGQSSNRTRSRTVSVRFALTTLSVAGCGGSSGGATVVAPSTTPVAAGVIYVVLPLHGRAASDTRSMLAAVGLVAARAKPPAKVVPIDVASVASCHEAGVRAVADRSSLAVIGSFRQECTAELARTLQHSGLALISPVGADAAQRGVVRLAPSTVDLERAVPTFARTLGVTHLGIVAQRSADSGVTAEQAATERPPMPTTFVQSVALARLARLAQTRQIDGVFLAGAPGAWARRVAVRALRANPGIVLIASEAFYSRSLRIEGLHVLTRFAPASRLGDAASGFSDDFAVQNGEPRLYDVYAADAAQLVTSAKEQTRAGVLRVFKGPDAHAGLTRTFSIQPDGSTSPLVFGASVVRAGVFQFDRIVRYSQTSAAG